MYGGDEPPVNWRLWPCLSRGHRPRLNGWPPYAAWLRTQSCISGIKFSDVVVTRTDECMRLCSWMQFCIWPSGMQARECKQDKFLQGAVGFKAIPIYLKKSHYSHSCTKAYLGQVHMQLSRILSYIVMTPNRRMRALVKPWESSSGSRSGAMSEPRPHSWQAGNWNDSAKPGRWAVTALVANVSWIGRSLL